MIETNVRNVKRLDDGSYSAITKAQKGIESLCIRCANNSNCSELDQIQTLNKASAKIISCLNYQWPIAFRNVQGTEHKFNTMRLGKAWYSRLKKGDIVGLLNTSGILYGYAKVISTHLLEKSVAIRDHAIHNHLMLNKTREYALERFEKEMRASYGNMIYNNNFEISVIYLQRCA